MKKALIAITAFFLSMHLHGQDIALLSRIKAANGKIKTFEANLNETMVKPHKTITREGKLYFVAPKEFAALFSEGSCMIGNEKRIKMDIGRLHGTFKLKNGGMMQSIGNIFLYSFQGRIEDLFNENGYSFTAKTEEGLHIITGTIIRKNFFGLGYKKVIIKYRTDDLLFKEIVLYDYSGNEDTYTLSNVNYDVEVKEDTFQF
jgi:outer membrane lipoprotein-sorting protein